MLTDEKRKQFIADNLHLVTERFKDNFFGYEKLEGKALQNRYASMQNIVRRVDNKNEKNKAEEDFNAKDLGSTLIQIENYRYKGASTFFLKDLKERLAKDITLIDRLIEKNKENDIEHARQELLMAAKKYNDLSGNNATVQF